MVVNVQSKLKIGGIAYVSGPVLYKVDCNVYWQQYSVASPKREDATMKMSKNLGR